MNDKKSVLLQFALEAAFDRFRSICARDIQENGISARNNGDSIKARHAWRPNWSLQRWKKRFADERGFRSGCSAAAAAAEKLYFWMSAHTYTWKMKRPNLSDSLDLFLRGDEKVERPPHNTTARGRDFSRVFARGSRVSQYTVCVWQHSINPVPNFSRAARHRRDDPWLFFTWNFYFQVKQDIKNRSHIATSCCCKSIACYIIWKDERRVGRKGVHIMWTRGLRRRRRCSKSVWDWSCKYRIWSGFSGASQVRATPLVFICYTLVKRRALFSEGNVAAAAGKYVIYIFIT